MKEPLDIYDDMPQAMKRYVSHYGWNFNKKACMYAVKRMRKENPSTKKKEHIIPTTKEQLEEMLTRHNVELEHNELYNHVYVFNMIKADYMGVSIDDEKHSVLHLKAIIDDVDNPGGNVMKHWYDDEVRKGHGVEFEDFLDDD
jgi:hypothetical protein